MATAALLDIADLRRDVRITVVHRTIVSFAGEAEQGAALQNISRFGVLISCLAPRAEGPLRIRLPWAGDVAAEAVWSMGDRIGCQFIEPFAPADYALILAGMERA